MENIEEFVNLIDRALHSARKVSADAKAQGVKWMQEDAETAIFKFERLREQVFTQTLPVSDGAGLGIARALSEWAPPELYKAGIAVEEYFINKWVDKDI